MTRTYAGAVTNIARKEVIKKTALLAIMYVPALSLCHLQIDQQHQQRVGAHYQEVDGGQEGAHQEHCSKVGVGDGTLLTRILPVDEALYPLMHVILVS